MVVALKLADMARDLAPPFMGQMLDTRRSRPIRLSVGRIGNAATKGSVSAQPAPFFELVVHDLAVRPGLTGVHAGYEQKKWRAQQLADHLLEWIPEFALGHSEFASIDGGNAVERVRRAVHVVYKSNKFKRRGEFGELLLHVLLRQCFATIPAISKMFYKDSPNDTVKGFDAVHVVAPPNDPASLELWLGEVKFYASISQAIAVLVGELKDHTEDKFLRSEFAAITNKIDPTWPHAEKLKKLLHPNTSLDDIFATVCIPVLLTYDSNVVAAHAEKTAAFTSALELELRSHHGDFCTKVKCNLRIHLFLLPMNTKQILLAALQERLVKWQQL